jgi:hypothetical protein
MICLDGLAALLLLDGITKIPSPPNQPSFLLNNADHSGAGTEEYLKRDDDDSCEGAQEVEARIKTTSPPKVK